MRGATNLVPHFRAPMIAKFMGCLGKNDNGLRCTDKVLRRVGVMLPQRLSNSISAHQRHTRDEVCSTSWPPQALRIPTQCSGSSLMCDDLDVTLHHHHWVRAPLQMWNALGRPHESWGARTKLRKNQAKKATEYYQRRKGAQGT